MPAVKLPIRYFVVMSENVEEGSLFDYYIVKARVRTWLDLSEIRALPFAPNEGYATFHQARTALRAYLLEKARQLRALAKRWGNMPASEAREE